MGKFGKVSALLLGLALSPSAFSATSELTLAKQVIEQDFQAISHLAFGSVSPLHQKTFGSGSPSDIVRFFNSRTRIIRWGREDDARILARAGGGALIVGEQLFSEISSLFRVSVLLHEAKHNERKHWAHAPCPSPYMVRYFDSSFPIPSLDEVDEEVCDRTENGAYGVTYIFLRTIAESCTNCSAEMKLEARVLSAYNALAMIADKAATERLILGANLDPAAAMVEHERVFLNKAASGLTFDAWFEKCKREDSCLR